MSELPTGWIPTSLGEIGHVQSGMGFPVEDQGSTSERYPVYKVGDVSRGVLRDGGVLRRSTNYVSAEVALKLGGHIFPEGTVLFAKIGEALRLNRRALVKLEGLADNNVMGFKAALEVDDAFVFRFLQTQNLAALSRSTTIPSIRKGDVEGVVVNLPPAAEQTHIAQKLDELLAQVDTLKARIDAIPALLKRFRQSILTAAASGQLTEVWRAEHTGVGVWCDARVEDVIDEMRNGLAAKPDEDPAGSKILRISAVRSGQLDVRDHRYLVVSPREKELYALCQGDLLFTRYNGSLEFVGVCAMVRHNLEGYVYPDKIIRARVNLDMTVPAFLEMACSTESARRQIEGFVKSSAGQKGISGADLKSVTFDMPPIKEQTEIVRRVEQLFAFADQLEAKVTIAKQRIDTLTQSILAKAFRGELVPQDPNDEPASVLLERICAQRAAAPKPRRGRSAST